MKLLYSKRQVDQRIAEVGREISHDYKGGEFVMVGVLKGCTVFMAHLTMEVMADLEIDFVTISSYGEGDKSGELRLLKDLEIDVTGRDVLIVEDIVDTGKTVAFLSEHLANKGAQSVRLVTFVDKKARREFPEVQADYVCFDYEGGSFLVGFGFDYGEKYRNLKGVYTL